MKRRNGIKVGVKSEESKPKKANKMPFQIRLKPDLQDFIDEQFNNGSFKTKTAVVESALEFMRAYIARQEESRRRLPLKPEDVRKWIDSYILRQKESQHVSEHPASLSASPSDSA